MISSDRPTRSHSILRLANQLCVHWNMDQCSCQLGPAADSQRLIHESRFLDLHMPLLCRVRSFGWNSAAKWPFESKEALKVFKFFEL